MPLNIKDKATEQAVRALAAATHETVTEAVRRAAEERLRRLGAGRPAGSLAAEITAIGRRCAALPDVDTRPADDILGYDADGLPT